MQVTQFCINFAALILKHQNMEKQISRWRTKNSSTKTDLRNAAIYSIVFSAVSILVFLVALIHPILCIIAVTAACFFIPVLLERLIR